MNISEKSVFSHPWRSEVAHFRNSPQVGARHGLFISDLVKPHAVMSDETGTAQMNEQ